MVIKKLDFQIVPHETQCSGFASVAHFQDPKHKKIERSAVTGAQTDGQNWASQFFASEEKGQYKDVYAKNRWPKIGPTSFSLQNYTPLTLLQHNAQGYRFIENGRINTCTADHTNYEITKWHDSYTTTGLIIWYIHWGPESLPNLTTTINNTTDDHNTVKVSITHEVFNGCIERWIDNPQ
ncbi:hypothetical protein RhiirA4_493560 [Rhizophagus irregularis]|uniref:Uncharacterized protein n=1 Tax=Rhizophagus irregularis TaxID=588596 RepID=A0A2I1FTY5_9GLOM|nr:hypothetical protein RhiirA4_493560 [Rhizophagus irregularis]